MGAFLVGCSCISAEFFEECSMCLNCEMNQEKCQVLSELQGPYGTVCHLLFELWCRNDDLFTYVYCFVAATRQESHLGT